MKDAARSYITFTRTERYGLVALCGLIVLLIAIRMALPYFAHTATGSEEEKRQRAAWEVYKRSQPVIPIAESPDDSSAAYTDAADESETPLPGIININTADSATLVRLKGIGPAMAHKIIMYRKVNGRFTRVEQLQEVQAIPPGVFAILKPHLSVE